MNELDLQSEQYAATGGVGAEGALNLLGRPDMDVLSLLMRETVQNSWDARLGDSEPVEFHLDAWALSSPQRRVLNDVVFRHRPPALPLAQVLGAPGALIGLGIADRGTKGLVGPTRADAMVPPDRRNFVALLRDVGRPRSLAAGGGTYGFGKASLYLAGRSHAVIVYTRCRGEAGAIESRFMAAALGEAYDLASGRFTGRHWWGRRHGGDPVADPLVGEGADRLAAILGMRGFEGDQTGTTLLIIAPRFPGDDPESCDAPPGASPAGNAEALRRGMNAMTARLAWYAWPKMVPEDRPAIHVYATVEGAAVQFPGPGKHPVLGGFVKALEALREARASGEVPEPSALPFRPLVREVWCKSPKKKLGLLALQRFPIGHFTADSDSDAAGDEPAAPFAGPSRHVALIRRPELVVEYLACEPLVDDAVQYAAVMRVEDDLDALFAQAEPPTHDGWVPKMLEKPNDRKFVNRGREHSRELAREFVGPRGGAAPVPSDVPLGALALTLGKLIPDLSGEDNLPPTNRARGGRQRSTTHVQINRYSLKALQGRLVAIVEFCVKPARAGQAIRVEATPAILIQDGEAEREPPLGGAQPIVLGWHGPDGKWINKGRSNCLIPAAQSGQNCRWSVAVSVPGDVAITVDVRPVEVEAGL